MKVTAKRGSTQSCNIFRLQLKGGAAEWTGGFYNGTILLRIFTSTEAQFV